MKNIEKDATAGDVPTAKDIRIALARICKSDAFEGAERLKGILCYVVEEALEGRAKLIRAKTIALDVYGYSADEVGDRESVVRVDAGRLRRKLNEYFGAEGRADPVVITVPKGSYVPVFSLSEAEKAQPALSNTGRRIGRRVLMAGLASILITLFGLGYYWQAERDAVDPPGDRARQKRSAIFEASPARLQAINLAEEGRDLIFPAVEPTRLASALGVFQSAIERDDTYYGGYAGAAQVQALSAMIAPDSNTAAMLLADAQANVNSAIELAPEAAWSQSARAILKMAEGNWGAAKTFSERAFALGPDDPHVLEYDALIALFSGNFQRVTDVVGAALDKNPGPSGYVFQNALGSARFHLGDLTGAIATFEQAIADGAPVGPVSVAYLMAAYYRLGNYDYAAELARQYGEAWPDRRIDLLFQRLFRDPKYGAELAEGMRGAGWSPD